MSQSISLPLLCPLCPLHCDDVVVGKAGRLSVPSCSVADGFCGPDSDVPGLSFPKLQGHIPKVITAGVDLVTARQLTHLHQSGEIQLAIESDPSIAAIGRVASRDGIVACTLSEITARADWVMTIGDVSGAWPRFSVRVQKDSLVQRGATWVDCDGMGPEEATEFITKPIDSLLSSQYAVIVIGPRAFPGEDAEKVASVLARWVRNRNATTRAHLMTLDAAATLKSVSLWRMNALPPIVSCAAELDLAPEQSVIRIGSPPRETSIYADVQIGGADDLGRTCRTYQPAALAGWNFESVVIRGDGAVTLPLGRIPLPSS